METEILVVGGNVAGRGFVSSILKINPQTQITLVRRENKALVPCGIPYIFGTLKLPDNNAVSDESMVEKGVNILVDEVTAIDKERKLAVTASGEKIIYNKLVLATGSLPVVPGIGEGGNFNNIYFIFKDLDYLTLLKNYLKEKKKVVIVGGGFIGVELAEELSKLIDGSITIVECGPTCLWQSFDLEFAQMVEKILCEIGIKIYKLETVKKFIGHKGNVKQIELTGGGKLDVDAVIFAAGVYPNTTLGKAIGLPLDKFGAIKVDKYMRADKDIYAIGDCASKQDYFTGEPVSVMLGSIAATEAKIAAHNLYNLTGMFRNGTLSIVLTSLNGISFGSVGLTEGNARVRGFNTKIGSVQVYDRHPACLPGAVKQIVKLVFDKETGVILGGQACGGQSVGELVNIIGLAVQTRMTASQILALQMGTHPLMTPGPTMYTITNAAENSLVK
ncbi:FAD-dependent pyridine nucleotide-disulfide oxidoreductase [Thermincola ferriacetica]|uniref:FAD-dependent pyridine nucleotide-disulfide oxidoreductase n=1 Tax=Thermincola ferriacetica TaxID=281456 RepID=A0A0L6W6I3_9FIRM|nr:FAD-dependent oxidoreductase [Thermincola ferriacetica]KNZ71130.1 FAD-dependent pyridine nucleotide-disulfide oxidoreductase [Thermincola ferriacetica]